MDVSFSASGAINRAHYALVHKVETALNPDEADSAIIQEIDSIRARFSKESFMVAACGEWLLVLLYCSTVLSFGLPRPDYLEFALPAAVSLSEGGRTFRDRRIGYLFCSQHLPPGHTLNLMLVNTIRKDLESSDEPRVCLALDMLIQLPSPDVIPAIQARLEDLVSHHSGHVKRRVLLAFRALSQHDNSILGRITSKAKTRLQDRDVKASALATAVDLAQAGIFPASEIIPPIMKIVRRLAKHKQTNGSILYTQTIGALGQLVRLDPFSGQQLGALPAVLESIDQSSRTGREKYGIVVESFRTLSAFPLSYLKEALFSGASTSPHPVGCIRRLLQSKDANLQYVLLSCLLCLDASLWAGTEEGFPAQLAESEVHHIMSFLESNDSSIRRLTCHVLRNVDPALLESYLAHYISTIPSPYRHSLIRCEHYACRGLEIAELLDSEGSAYSARVIEILHAVQLPHEGPDKVVHDDAAHLHAAKEAGWGDGARAVLESAVEMVLGHLREASETFRTTFTNDICHSTLLYHAYHGPTVVLIASAVACEYGDHLVVDQAEVLRGLNGQLKDSSVALKEAILLSMLRAAARLAEGPVPEDIVSSVTTLESHSGRHIRFRCNQFLSLIKDLQSLKAIAESAKSSTLPDFLAAVDARSIQSPKRSRPPSLKATGSTVSSPSQRPLHNLRYDAYLAPPPAGSKRRSTPSARSSSVASDRSLRPHHRPGDGEPAAQATRGRFPAPATAMEDALGANSALPLTPRKGQLPNNSLITRMDLISLESPFHANPPGAFDIPPPTPESATDSTQVPFKDQFDAAWSALVSTTRGWREQSPAQVAKDLEDSELGFLISGKNLESQVPTEGGELHGEVLCVLPGPEGTWVAAVRLKLGDEGSCLWVLKCDDSPTRLKIKAILQKDE